MMVTAQSASMAALNRAASNARTAAHAILAPSLISSKRSNKSSSSRRRNADISADTIYRGHTLRCYSYAPHRATKPSYPLRSYATCMAPPTAAAICAHPRTPKSSSNTSSSSLLRRSVSECAPALQTWQVTSYNNIAVMHVYTQSL